jgi:hypothetical protein
MLTVIDRWRRSPGGEGRIGEEMMAALKSKARRRLVPGAFFGPIAYASCQAVRPSRRGDR